MVPEAPAPARRQQRKTIFIFFFLSGLISASWSSRIPDVQQKLGLDNAAMGAVLSALYIGLFVGLTIASWLVASFGSLKVMVTTCTVSALFLVLAGSSASVFWLTASLLLMGFGRTIFNLAANTGAIEVQQQYRRPIVSGFHGVWSVACFVAGLIGTSMIVLHVRPFLHFTFVAIIIIAAVVATRKKSSGSMAKRERRSFFVKPDKYLLLLGLMALSVMLCEGAMFDWSVSYFEHVIHARRSLVTVGYMSFIIAMAAGRLFGDRLIAAFGMFNILFLNATLLCIGFLVAASFPFVFPAALGFLFIGLGDSVLVPVIYMLAAKSEKMPTAYALSVVTLIGYLGFIIGPLFIGNVSKHFGLPVTFYCLAGISLFLFALSLAVKRLTMQVQPA